MNIWILTCKQSDATQELEHCFIHSSLLTSSITLHSGKTMWRKGRCSVFAWNRWDCVYRQHSISWLTDSQLTWMSPGFSSGSVGANPVPIVPRYASRFYTHTHPECGGRACTDMPIRKWPSCITPVPAYLIQWVGPQALTLKFMWWTHMDPCICSL